MSRVGDLNPPSSVDAPGHDLPQSRLHIEFRVVHPDGSSRWLHARGQALMDATGEVASGRGTVLLGAAGTVLRIVEPATGQVRTLTTSVLAGEGECEVAIVAPDVPLPTIHTAVTVDAPFFTDRQAALERIPGVQPPAHVLSALDHAARDLPVDAMAPLVPAQVEQGPAQGDAALIAVRAHAHDGPRAVRPGQPTDREHR